MMYVNQLVDSLAAIDVEGDLCGKIVLFSIHVDMVEFSIKEFCS